MNLTTWTDEELKVLHEKLHAWSVRHHASKWENRFWKFTALAGAFAVIDGVFSSIPAGINAPDTLEIVLGAIICFSWYRGDKRYKSNTGLLEKLNTELNRRGTPGDNKP